LTSLWNQPGLPEPVGSQDVYPDYLASVLAPLIVTAALLRRQRTGEGAVLDLAQVEAAAYMLGRAFLELTVNGTDPQPVGNATPGTALEGCFPCTGDDRWLAITCDDAAAWRRLCTVTGIDPATPAREDAVACCTSVRAAEEAMVELRGGGVVCGVVQSGLDLAEDLHLRARGFVETGHHPRLGEVRARRAPFRFAEVDLRSPWAAPALGEHNREILCGLLGRSLEELARLERGGVVA
jgi:benzylsuccinate CoA-transferase BbsF subunit